MRVGLALRVEDLVLVDVARVLVVVAVRELPGLEGCEDDRVHERADAEVEHVRAREGAVAAVVAHREEAPEHDALQQHVARAERDVERRVCLQQRLLARERERHGQRAREDERARRVVERQRHGRLEAVARQRALDVRQRRELVRSGIGSGWRHGFVVTSELVGWSLGRAAGAEVSGLVRQTSGPRSVVVDVGHRQTTR